MTRKYIRKAPIRSINILERIERHSHELRDNECWETDYTGGNGFGHVLIRLSPHKMVYLHRVAWEAHHAEPIPEGMVVMHTCDNPRCFNPEHLRLGTLKDNTRDMCSKGRANVSRNPDTGRYQ